MAKRGNGEGTIYYSEKLNKWVGQFTAGRNANGKLNRKSVYGNTRKEVKEKMTKALAEVQDNTFIDKDCVTFSELLDQYIENQFNANQISEVSYLRKKGTANIIKKLDFADKEIQKITISQINSSLIVLIDYSNSVINKVVGLCSTIFDYAVLNKIIASNPFKINGAIIRPKSKKETKQVDSLTEDETKLLLEELQVTNDKYKDVFYIALYTGMRIGEILALKGSDINDGIINITKTLTRDKDGKVIAGNTTKTYSGLREIPILDILKPILANYTTDDYLFLNNGKFIEPNNINSHFKRICVNANIRVFKSQRLIRGKYYNFTNSKVNTHMLRHTFATRCIENHMSAVVLSKYLGHKDIETTLNTYTSVFNKFKEQELKNINDYFTSLH